MGANIAPKIAKAASTAAAARMRQRGARFTVEIGPPPPGYRAARASQPLLARKEKDQAAHESRLSPRIPGHRCDTLAGLIVRGEIEFRPGELRCPRCLSKDFAPSLPRGWRDALMRSLSRIPRHCRACGRRFYVPERKPEASADTAEQL